MVRLRLRGTRLAALAVALATCWAGAVQSAHADGKWFDADVPLGIKSVDFYGGAAGAADESLLFGGDLGRAVMRAQPDGRVVELTRPGGATAACGTSSCYLAVHALPDGRFWTVTDYGIQLFDAAGRPLTAAVPACNGDAGLQCDRGVDRAVAGDGSLWLARGRLHPTSGVIRVTPSGTTAALDCPSRCATVALAAARDGGVWQLAVAGKSRLELRHWTAAGAVDQFRAIGSPTATRLTGYGVAEGTGGVWVGLGDSEVLERTANSALFVPQAGDPLPISVGLTGSSRIVHWRDPFSLKPRMITAPEGAGLMDFRSDPRGDAYYTNYRGFARLSGRAAFEYTFSDLEVRQVVPTPGGGLWLIGKSRNGLRALRLKVPLRLRPTVPFVTPFFATQRLTRARRSVLGALRGISIAGRLIPGTRVTVTCGGACAGNRRLRTMTVSGGGLARRFTWTIRRRTTITVRFERPGYYGAWQRYTFRTGNGRLLAR